MAIKYAGENKIGYGTAQVFDKSNLVEQASGVIAKQQARRDAAAAKKAAAAKAKKDAGNTILDDLNKVDFSKVRDAEVGVITNGGDKNQTIGVNGIYKYAQDNLDAIIDPSIDGGKAKMQFEQHKTQLQGYIVQSINQKERDTTDYKSMITNDELYTEENEVGLAKRKGTTIGSAGWSNRDVQDPAESDGQRTEINEDGSIMSVPTSSGAGNYEITPDANLERELQSVADELKNKRSSTTKGKTFSIGNGNLAVEFKSEDTFDRELVVQAGKNMIQNHKWNRKLGKDLQEYLDDGYTEDEAIYEIMRPFLDEQEKSTIKTSAGKKKGGKGSDKSLTWGVVTDTSSNSYNKEGSMEESDVGTFNSRRMISLSPSSQSEAKGMPVTGLSWAYRTKGVPSDGESRELQAGKVQFSESDVFQPNGLKDFGTYQGEDVEYDGVKYSKGDLMPQEIADANEVELNEKGQWMLSGFVPGTKESLLVPYTSEVESHLKTWAEKNKVDLNKSYDEVGYGLDRTEYEMFDSNRDIMEKFMSNNSNVKSKLEAFKILKKAGKIQ